MRASLLHPKKELSHPRQLSTLILEVTKTTRSQELECICLLLGWVGELQLCFKIQTLLILFGALFQAAYVGEYVDGKRHGMGYMIYPDGGIYEGHFVADKFEGGVRMWLSSFNQTGFIQSLSSSFPLVTGPV